MTWNLAWVQLLSIAAAIVGKNSVTQPCFILPPYDGVSVVQVAFADPQQAERAQEGLTSICQIKLFNPEGGFSNSVNALLVNSEQLRFLRSTLDEHAITVLASDLGLRIRREAEAVAPHIREEPVSLVTAFAESAENAKEVDTFYTNYHGYPALVRRWKHLNKTYPSLRLESIGESFEKRPIHIMRIGNTSSERPVRVLFNGLQHAREWVTTVAATYAAETFAVTTLKNSSKLSELLGNVEMLILPLVNPDGYVYTHTTDRLWRKNRQESICDFGFPGGFQDTHAGIDLNRNWGVDFNGIQSTSTNPCSELYIGKSAFSAPETAAIRDFVRKTPGIMAHVDIHSYSQLVIGPWGHTDEIPPNAHIVDLVGNALAADLSSGGRSYSYGRGLNNGMYLASGTMSDWFFARGILSFTFELRPDGFSNSGFELDHSEILPTCKEVFNAVSTLVEYSKSASLLTAGEKDKISRSTNIVVTYAVGFGTTGLVLVALAICCTTYILRWRRRSKVEENNGAEHGSSSSELCA